ncbi:hypothetical protein EYR38_002550 [Pleurotus pulmonarius]|nr:hypothetical protein EYR38_002550 [Pleurotus pulmonarius]
MDSTYEDALIPPLGTSYYSHKSFKVFDGRCFRGGGSLRFTVSWHVDAHIYATEAPPAASNYTGTVYIVFIHSGTIVSPRGDIYDPTVFTVTPADKSQVLPVAQEPKTWEPLVVNIGRMYGSHMQLAQALPMFRNSGREAFTFDAKYNATLVGHYKHSGRVAGHRAEFSIEAFEITRCTDGIQSMADKLPRRHDLPAEKAGGQELTPSKSNFIAVLGQKLGRWGVESTGIQLIPVEERTDTQYHKLFFFWFTANVNILSFSAGALAPVFGLGLRDACLVILFFNLVCTAFPAYLSTWGPKLGLRQMVQARYSFGFHGVMLPCVMNLIGITGFCILNCILGGQTLSSVTDGHLTWTVGIVVTAVISLLLSFCGYRVLGWYEKVAWLPVLIVFLVALGVSGSHLSLPQTEESPPAASVLSFGASIAGFVMSWSGMASDFATYFHPNVSSWRIFAYTYFGLLLPTVTLQCLGVACTIAASSIPAWEQGLRDGNVVTIRARRVAVMLQPAGNFGKFLTVLLAISVTGNIAVSMYAFCLNFQVFVPVLSPVPRYVFSLVATAIVIPLAIVGSHRFNDTLANFLGLLGYWSGAFAAIMTTEQLVFRRHDPDNYNTEDWNSPSRLPIGAAALFSGLAAFGIAVVCMDQVWFVGPAAKTTGDIGFEVAVVAAGLLYAATRALEVRKWEHVHSPHTCVVVSVRSYILSIMDKLDEKESGVSVKATSKNVLSNLAQRLRQWGVETRGIQPIPADERTDTRYNRIFFIWLSSNFNILSFSVGAVFPSYGLRFRDACAIIMCFNLFFTIFPAYLCTWGPKLGLRQMVQGRYTFGYFGVILPCLLNMMTVSGYAALTCIVGGQALSAVGGGGIGLTIGIVIVGVASLILSFCGYKVLSWFDQLAWIPVFIVCLVMIGVGAKHIRIDDGSGPAPALASVFNYGLLAGAAISWSAASSDFTSHFPPSAPSYRLFLYAYLGIIIPTTSMSILGAAFGAGVANVPSWQEGFTDANVGGFIAAILEPAGNFGKFLMVLLALGVIANIAMNFYCFCVNVEVFLPILLNTPRYIFSLVAAAIVIPVAIVGSRSFSDTLGNFLGVIAYWSGPFAAILSTEHLLFRRGRQESYDINKWNSPSQLPTGLAALVAGAIGTTMGILCMNQAWYVGPIAKTTGDIGLEVSLATAFLMYIPFRLLEVSLWRDIQMPSLRSLIVN